MALLLAVLASPAVAQVPPPSAMSPQTDTLTVLPDDWLGRDKAMHAGLSFALTAGGALALRHMMDARTADAVPFAVGTALALGVTKEISDSRRPRAPLFSWRDLVADAVGVALGAVVASL